jgi:hypothetical protein
MSYTNATHLTTSREESLKTLDFYEKELDISGNRLLEVAKKNTGGEAVTGIEHFQNQFIVQRRNITELKHRITANHHQAADDALHHAGKVEIMVAGANSQIGEDVKIFEKIFNELRQEFKVFLTKWM